LVRYFPNDSPLNITHEAKCYFFWLW
jgi:hypothetical protein